MKTDKDKLFSYIVFAASILFTLYLALAFKVTFSWPLLWKLVFYGLLIILCELFPIKLPKAGSVSISSLIIMATWLTFGPVETVFVALFGCIWPDIKKQFHIILFNCGQYILAAAMAAFIYRIISPYDPTSFPVPLIAFAFSIAVFHLVNSWLVSISISIAKSLSPVKVWLANVRWGLLNFLSIAVLAVVFYELNNQVGFIGVALLLVPLIIARQTYQYYVKLTDAYAGTVSSLIKAVEAKDPYTRGHSERVAEISVLIGKELGLSEPELQSLKRVATLHDIGKIGVPKKILTKPASLTEEEFDLVKEHPKIGVQILKNVEFLADYIPAVYYHHERVDGTGYNSGLSGDNIPLYARIISIADSYDAMTSDRAYRKALSKKQVIAEFEKGMGTQFDAVVVQAMFSALKLIKDDKEALRVIEKALEPSPERV